MKVMNAVFCLNEEAVSGVSDIPNTEEQYTNRSFGSPESNKVPGV